MDVLLLENESVRLVWGPWENEVAQDGDGDGDDCTYDVHPSPSCEPVDSVQTA